MNVAINVMTPYLVASRIKNANLRGRLIEFLITADDVSRQRMTDRLQNGTQSLPAFITHDDLGDYEKKFDDEVVYTDIKTKILSLNSAPKAYNVDKFLKKMSEPGSSFFFSL